MSVRRREALGRNRRGPNTTNTMGTLLVVCVAIVGLAVFAYRYLTQPERVFGHKTLNCPVTEIEWAQTGRSTLIRGCGREVEAVCGELCIDADEAPDPAELHPGQHGYGF